MRTKRCSKRRSNWAVYKIACVACVLGGVQWRRLLLGRREPRPERRRAPRAEAAESYTAAELVGAPSINRFCAGGGFQLDLAFTDPQLRQLRRLRIPEQVRGARAEGIPEQLDPGA